MEKVHFTRACFAAQWLMMAVLIVLLFVLKSLPQLHEKTMNFTHLEETIQALHNLTSRLG